MANHAKNLAFVFKGDYGAGTHRKTISASAWPLGGLQWVHATTGLATPATITIYASLLPFGDERLTDLDPSTNPYWAAQPAAVFGSNPGGVVKSEMLTLADSPYATLLVEMVVVDALTDFALLWRGQEA